VSILLETALAHAPVFLSAQLPLTTVVDLSQRNSSAVRLAWGDVQKARGALSETRDIYVPVVAFDSGLPALPSVGFQGNPPSIMNVTMQSLVFSPPQRQYIEAAQDRLKAAILNLTNAREQAALHAATVYIELDTVEQELDAAQQQEAFSARLVDIERERTKAGVDPLDDLLQAKLTAAELELKYLHLQTRVGTLATELAGITGLPVTSIVPEHASIPDIPEIHIGESMRLSVDIESAQMLARSKQKLARGDKSHLLRPQIGFSAQYNRDTALLNNANSYFARPLKSDNFSSGFSIQIPLLDLAQRARARQSAADALQATVEAEQAQEKHDLHIVELTDSLRELNAQEKIASLKQKIAEEQIKTVLIQLELGNGAGNGPSARPQLTPKAEYLARIDERQKFEDALESGFNLSKARLALLSAQGHMEDWLREPQIKSLQAVNQSTE
jgi:outer membrane protein TolC